MPRHQRTRLGKLVEQGLVRADQLTSAKFVELFAGKEILTDVWKEHGLVCLPPVERSLDHVRRLA